VLFRGAKQSTQLTQLNALHAQLDLEELMIQLDVGLLTSRIHPKLVLEITSYIHLPLFVVQNVEMGSTLIQRLNSADNASMLLQVESHLVLIVSFHQETFFNALHVTVV
jgi:hypothetical protein